MNHETNHVHHRPANGAAKVKPAMKKDPGTTVELGAPEILHRIEREIQEHPVRSLGLAAVIGMGVGALVVSTLGRRALFAGAAYLGRELLRNGANSLLASARA